MVQAARVACRATTAVWMTTTTLGWQAKASVKGKFMQNQARPRASTRGRRRERQLFYVWMRDKQWGKPFILLHSSFFLPRFFSSLPLFLLSILVHRKCMRYVWTGVRVIRESAKGEREWVNEQIVWFFKRTKQDSTTTALAPHPYGWKGMARFQISYFFFLFLFFKRQQIGHN